MGIRQHGCGVLCIVMTWMGIRQPRVWCPALSDDCGDIIRAPIVFLGGTPEDTIFD